MHNVGLAAATETLKKMHKAALRGRSPEELSNDEEEERKRRKSFDSWSLSLLDGRCASAANTEIDWMCAEDSNQAHIAAFESSKDKATGRTVQSEKSWRLQVSFVVTCVECVLHCRQVSDVEYVYCMIVWRCFGCGGCV